MPSFTAFSLRHLSAAIGRRLSRSSDWACYESALQQNKPFSLLQALSAAVQLNRSNLDPQDSWNIQNNVSVGLQNWSSFHSTSCLAKAKAKAKVKQRNMRPGEVKLIRKDESQPDLPQDWRAPEMTPKEMKKLKPQIAQERTHAIIVGKDGFTEAFGLTVRQFLKTHAFAKVALKQRPMGITVKKCIEELERMTGGICVVKEPTKVTIYRGWPRGGDPPWLKQDSETGEVSPVSPETEGAAAKSESSGRIPDSSVHDREGSAQGSDGSVQGSGASGRDSKGSEKDSDTVLQKTKSVLQKSDGSGRNSDKAAQDADA